MIRRISSFESCKVSLHRRRAKVLPKLPKTKKWDCLRGSVDRDYSRGDICTQRRHTWTRSKNFNLGYRQQPNDALWLKDSVWRWNILLLSWKLLPAMHPVWIRRRYFISISVCNSSEKDWTNTQGYSPCLKELYYKIALVWHLSSCLWNLKLLLETLLMLFFPQMTLKACCFHFTLCIWRKTQACGLAGLEWYIECWKLWL